MVATAGWTQTSGRSLWDVAEDYPDARHLLVTDISRDGMMSGPNVELIAETSRRLPHLDVQASGGVASLDDLRALKDAGAAGAIIGKAFWEGRIDLGEALDIARA
jgi:phosphoribosylformimino-5-aminoimidazole carboxamide ribotide isomerase